VGERAGGGFNPVVFLLYRIYGADRGSLPPNSAEALLPSVTVYDADGRVRVSHEECDPYPPGSAPPEDTTRFPVFPVPDYRAAIAPGALSTESNWGMPVDLLANGDVFYLTTLYGRQHGEVFAVRFAAPRTPSRHRAVALWDPTVQARMFSLCTYNFWNGEAIDCRIDEQLAVDDQGRHAIVVSDAARRPVNAIAEAGVTWLDAGPFFDGQLTWRFLFRDRGLPAAPRAVVESGSAPPEVAPYLPERVFCDRRDFEAGGFEACRARSRQVEAADASARGRSNPPSAP